jgi:signal transduction histidine kinase
VGWVLVSIAAALGSENAAFYWAILGVGVALLVLVLVGVIIYLALTLKAIALSQRQSNFIDSVTHELKSPLASLKLYLQTLTRRPVPPEQQADFHRFMLKDVERLDTLIDHLLDAAKTLQRRARPGTDATAEVSAVPTAADVAESAGSSPTTAMTMLDSGESNSRSRIWATCSESDAGSLNPSLPSRGKTLRPMTAEMTMTRADPTIAIRR